MMELRLFVEQATCINCIKE